MPNRYEKAQVRYLSEGLAKCHKVGLSLEPDQLMGLREWELLIWGMELLDTMNVRLNIGIEDLPKYWESHFAKVRLLQYKPYQEKANDLFREYTSLFGRNDSQSSRQRSDNPNPVRSVMA